MKITLPYKVVLLIRGESSKIPMTVFAHEMAVLRASHGDDSVQETDTIPPVLSAEIETDDEYVRLQQYYRGSSENSNPTKTVWRNEEEFEDYFAGLDAPVEDKDSLLAQALELGIAAKGTWGIAKLKAAIAEATAE